MLLIILGKPIAYLNNMDNNQTPETTIVKANNVTGDWIVTDRHRLVQRPWGEILWAVTTGSITASVMVSAYLYVAVNLKPNPAVIGTSALVGSAISLRANRKKFTFLERSEVFRRDKVK